MTLQDAIYRLDGRISWAKSWEAGAPGKLRMESLRRDLESAIGEMKTAQGLLTVEKVQLEGLQESIKTFLLDLVHSLDHAEESGLLSDNAVLRPILQARKLEATELLEALTTPNKSAPEVHI